MGNLAIDLSQANCPDIIVLHLIKHQHKDFDKCLILMFQLILKMMHCHNKGSQKCNLTAFCCILQGVPGLVNNGNMCYLNSVLQVCMNIETRLQYT